jgi:NAD(P)-dependent dehydrogenase (short-subunit alcohol dehydrogenase family)
MHTEVTELFDLTGKVAVVTGGARDLGWDAASILAAAGAGVVITSRDGARAAASAARLQERYGVEALGLGMDQSRFADVERAAGAAAEWKGRIDVLINNAGGGSGASPGDLFLRTPEDSAHLIEVNLTGALYCCREFGRAMERQRSGKIVNIASIAGMVGRDRRVYARSGMKGQPIDYAAAKAGVIGMTRDLAGYFGPKGVCVNVISPGGFNRALPETFVEDYSERTPLGRMGRDGIDLKGAILFLSSPAADYVTGVNLPVDGGFTMWK